MPLKTFIHKDLFPTRIHVAQDFLEEEEFEEIKLLVKEDKKNLDVPEFERKVMMHMGLICDDLGIDLLLNCLILASCRKAQKETYDVQHDIPYANTKN